MASALSIPASCGEYGHRLAGSRAAGGAAVGGPGPVPAGKGPGNHTISAGLVLVSPVLWCGLAGGGDWATKTPHLPSRLGGVCDALVSPFCPARSCFPFGPCALLGPAARKPILSLSRVVVFTKTDPFPQPRYVQVGGAVHPLRSLSSSECRQAGTLGKVDRKRPQHTCFRGQHHCCRPDVSCFVCEFSSAAHFAHENRSIASAELFPRMTTKTARLPHLISNLVMASEVFSLSDHGNSPVASAELWRPSLHPSRSPRAPARGRELRDEGLPRGCRAAAAAGGGVLQNGVSWSGCPGRDVLVPAPSGRVPASAAGGAGMGWWGMLVGLVVAFQRGCEPPWLAGTGWGCAGRSVC